MGNGGGGLPLPEVGSSQNATRLRAVARKGLRAATRKRRKQEIKGRGRGSERRLSVRCAGAGERCAGEQRGLMLAESWCGLRAVVVHTDFRKGGNTLLAFCRHYGLKIRVILDDKSIENSPINIILIATTYPSPLTVGPSLMTFPSIANSMRQILLQCRR